jgi:ferredoxin
MSMCEFCLKHGEGEKWYLAARNYSEDLLSDLKRRRFIEGYLKKPPRQQFMRVKRLELLEKAPAFVQRLIRWRVSEHYKKSHFGQVVPIEDVERILTLVNSVVRVACYCRYASLGRDCRYCYGISLGPDGGRFSQILSGIDGSFLSGPETRGVERIGKAEALNAMRANEKQGLCHSVWTFRTPFIGGICNCDRADCLAMRTTVTHGTSVMFRSEYLAEVDPTACNGCRLCMKVCQFGALSFSAAERKVSIDPRRCFGCGICRAVCKPSAIALRDRGEVPEAANLW